MRRSTSVFTALFAMAALTACGGEKKMAADSTASAAAASMDSAKGAMGAMADSAKGAMGAMADSAKGAMGAMADSAKGAMGAMADSTKKRFGPNTPAIARFRQRQDYGSAWVFGAKGTF